MKDTWLKLAAVGAAGCTAAGVALAAGPGAAVIAGVGAMLAAIPTLYAEPPKRRPKRDARGQIEDDEEPR
jgi:hypothetical protein